MAQQPGESQRLIVVDGDVLVRHVISDYLRTCGYVVIEAASTDEAEVVLTIRHCRSRPRSATPMRPVIRAHSSLGPGHRRDVPMSNSSLLGVSRRRRTRQPSYVKKVRSSGGPTIPRASSNTSKDHRIPHGGPTEQGVSIRMRDASEAAARLLPYNGSKADAQSKRADSTPTGRSPGPTTITGGSSSRFR